MKNSDQQDIDLITNGVQYYLRHQYTCSVDLFNGIFASPERYKVIQSLNALECYKVMYSKKVIENMFKIIVECH